MRKLMALIILWAGVVLAGGTGTFHYVMSDGTNLYMQSTGTNTLTSFMGTNAMTVTNKIIMWTQDTTNYSYITFSSNKFLVVGVSNGVSYISTNTVY